MLTKVVPILRAASRRMLLISRSGHGVPAHWKPMKQICLENKSHMNCLPVPEGCWKEDYKKKNARWNIALAASVVLLIVTIVAPHNGLESTVMEDMVPGKRGKGRSARRWEQDIRHTLAWPVVYLHSPPPRYNCKKPKS